MHSHVRPSTLPPAAVKESKEFDTLANDDQKYDTEPTNINPRAKNEGAYFNIFLLLLQVQLILQ